MRYQLISGDPDVEIPLSLTFTQSDVLAGIFCVLVSYMLQLFPEWKVESKIGAAFVFSVGTDKLTNALFWYTLLRSLCSGVLQSLFCIERDKTANTVLFVAWKLFSEVVALFLIMLFSDRWGHPDVYCT